MSALLIGTLSACSGTPEDGIEISDKTSVQEQYERAKAQLESGAYFNASEVLSALDSHYPFGPYSHQIQIDLIYAYYKSNKLAQAIASIERFMRLNPTHQSIDYVQYMKGLVNAQMARNGLQEFAGVERHDRDMSKIREAFSDFRKLITNHPNSKYVADSKQRLIFLKDFMAKSEIAVADYYISRSAYAAAANRAKYVLEVFEDSQQVERALEIMVESYSALKLPDLKADALSVLQLNYPKNKLSR